MPSTMTAPPDLCAKLAEATTEADRLRGEFANAEQERADAAARHDYPAAEQARQRVEDLRPHLALAEATEKALSEAVQSMRAQQDQAQAAARQQARHKAAEETLGAAVAAEAEAREDADRHLAAALAGVDAVRASLQLARRAEQAGADARSAVAHARAELDGGSAPAIVVPPNWVSGRIDHDEVLRAILHGTP